MVIICGIDEAGRGPVIGPMVMAACAIEKSEEDGLKKLGVADSKKLSAKKREELFPKVIALTEYSLEIVSAKAIDAALNDPYMNLNKLEALHTARLINSLNKVKKVDLVIVDLPTKDSAAYIEEVKKNLDDKTVDMIAEHKADDNYPIVSAASILAKVTRDKEIEKIQENIDVNIGSGYPSDPYTKEFIKKYHSNHDVFRKTWQTYKNVVDSKKQKKLGEF